VETFGIEPHDWLWFRPVPPALKEVWGSEQALRARKALQTGSPPIRLHGDCHVGNIL
jgi:hypothetical protein